MKQKLLTLFVLLVTAMTAFADASGSGVTAGNDINKNGISYKYQFTEQDGNVTFTVTPNLDGIIGYANTYIDDESHLQGDYETPGTTRTWKGLAKGTTIKVKGWFDAAGGRMYFDEVTYTTGTEAAPDTEKPVMVKAKATSIHDTKATLTLNATDNFNGILTYTVTIGENHYTVTGNAGKDVTIDITGLTAETKYDFSVTATDKANNVSEAKTGSFTTTTAFTLTAPATPTVDASKVISVLSAAYTPATTWNFGGWGQSTVSENIDVDGAPVIHLSKFNYIGLDGFSNQLDLSGMTHMHIDVLPVTMEGSLGVTPILASGGPTENPTKVGDKTTLKLGQWNAIDMPLSDFGLDFINNKVFQIKFDKGNNATDELYIANIYFYNNSVGEQTLQAITINNSLTGATSTLNTTVTPKASDGTVFNGTVTYTISDGAHLTAEGNNLTITADAAGTYTLTATSGTNTATTQVYFVGSAPTPTEAADNVLAYYSDQYTVENIKEYDSGWEKGWATSTDINLSATDQAKCVTGVGTWGLTKDKGLQDMTLYTKVCADIYAIEEIPYRITFEKTSIPEATGTLKNGWNHIEVPFNDAARTGMEYIKFNIGTDAKHDYTVLFDNIYASKADIKFNITTSGDVAKSIAKVVGPITAAEVEQINNVDAMNIDLTGATTIEEGITLQPLRKNAIIVISGTYKEETIDEKKVCTTTADSKFNAIKDMKNFVVLAADGFYHPLKQLEFVDIPGEPFWTGGLRDLNDFISTGSTGCKVTRTIKKGTHASICVPFAITPTSIPEGLYVWEATNYDTKNNIINFNKAVEVPGNFPCILRNTTDQDIELNWTWTGDINFGNYVGKDAEKKKLGDTDVYFCGNWKEALETDGKQWIIKNEGIHASIVKADGVKISPFRAYFTGIPEGASAKLNFDDEETTGITNVNAAESNDGTLYNLAGQKVNAAYKGIVIKNGKKYLVK